MAPPLLSYCRCVASGADLAPRAWQADGVTSALHTSALTTLDEWVPPTPGQAVLRDRYLTHLRAEPLGVLREGYPDHLSASTLVMSADGSRVLLTLHRKARRWFQLGGHVEPRDASLTAAALREATEESGVPGLVLDPVPVQIRALDAPISDPLDGVTHSSDRVPTTHLLMAAPTLY